MHGESLVQSFLLSFMLLALGACCVGLVWWLFSIFGPVLWLGLGVFGVVWVVVYRWFEEHG